MKLYTILGLLLITGCVTTYPNQDITGQTFPTISGTSLAQEYIEIPTLFEQKHTLLLIGYKQDSQFDIDRWLIGLDMTNTDVPVYELPTIKGMFPRMFSTMIDNGMRAGIPKQLWNGVITIYHDGDTVQRLTGNQQPNNARVILVDNKGKIIYFYDQGFAVDALNRVRNYLELE